MKVLLCADLIISVVRFLRGYEWNDGHTCLRLFLLPALYNSTRHTKGDSLTVNEHFCSPAYFGQRDFSRDVEEVVVGDVGPASGG